MLVKFRIIRRPLAAIALSITFVFPPVKKFLTAFSAIGETKNAPDRNTDSAKDG